MTGPSGRSKRESPDGDTPSDQPTGPAARDIVDVRLLDVLRGAGCPICAVRARSEQATLDAIIDERVLDLRFRADLERRSGFCRRHVAELVSTDRRRTGGILGSSLLLSAILDRRLGPVRAGLDGRKRRRRFGTAQDQPVRPPCIACSQGDAAVATALGRLADRASDEAWAGALADSPFCLDDLIALATTGAGRPSLEPVLRRHVERLDALRVRLEGFADHSSHDRRHLMTDPERSAADEATKVLGGG